MCVYTCISAFPFAADNDVCLARARDYSISRATTLDTNRVQQQRRRRRPLIITMIMFYFFLFPAETFAQELDLERKVRQQQSVQQNQQQSQHPDRDIKSPVPGEHSTYNTRIPIDCRTPDSEYNQNADTIIVFKSTRAYIET